MVSEYLQTDIISHDDFSRHAALVIVSGGRIQLGQKEASLAAILITVDKVRNGEPLLDDGVCLLQWILQRDHKAAEHKVVPCPAHAA